MGRKRGKEYYTHYTNEVEMLYADCGKLSQSPKFKKIKRLIVYDEETLRTLKSSCETKKIQKACKKIQRVNVSKIKKMKLFVVGINDFGEFNRTSLHSLLRYAPKVSGFLEFSNFSFSKHHMQHLLNSITTLNSIRFISCKLNTTGIKLIPTRSISITQIDLRSCISAKTCSRTFPIDLRSLLICISKSSLTDSVRTIFMKSCGFSMKVLETLSIEYCKGKTTIYCYDKRLGDYRDMPKTNLKCTLF
ncbi:unnamed protein product [Moneuplotes crassus]|uniref:Uncharacterized protein n=1 Tax=Euplotes crassus TaxID=5936 RepID=A0AAD2D2N9_EUPCR|nr:unnamed protein product [Moneuplotes crassus]